MKLRFTVLGREIWSLEIDLFSLEIVDDDEPAPTTDCGIGGGATHDFERETPSPPDWSWEEEDRGRRFGFC